MNFGSNRNYTCKEREKMPEALQAINVWRKRPDCKSLEINAEPLEYS